LAALGFPDGAEGGARDRNISNVELVRVPVNERVTIFLQQILPESNESLLNKSNKRENCKLLHFNVFGSAIHHKERETAIWEPSKSAEKTTLRAVLNILA
jgi:hypothetical protein